jgi:hypothetical protein
VTSSRSNASGKVQHSTRKRLQTPGMVRAQFVVGTPRKLVPSYVTTVKLRCSASARMNGVGLVADGRLRELLLEDSSATLDWLRRFDDHARALPDPIRQVVVIDGELAVDLARQNDSAVVDRRLDNRPQRRHG